MAYNRFGAVWGQGVGLQGQSYAIPTMQGGVETIKPYVDEFIQFANQNSQLTFLVTRIGCGIAGFRDDEIAPLFKEAWGIDNVVLPREFVEYIEEHQTHNPEGNYKPNAVELDKKKNNPSPEALKALMMWTMGAGNSAKRFNGENPIPAKSVVATKDSWTTLPMPEQHTKIPVGIIIPDNAMECVKYGHVPDAMEDHWFMYCDDNTIHYYRSWTGICIYEAKYEKVDDGYKITEIIANRFPEQYKCKDDKHDLALFMALLTEEYGGDASQYWDSV